MTETTDRLPVDEALVAAAEELTADAAVARHAELAIDRANRLYYEEDAPELTDAEYDRLFRELVALETAYPDLVTADSRRRSASAARSPGRSTRSAIAGRCSPCPTRSATTSCGPSMPGSARAWASGRRRSPRRICATSPS